MRLYEREVMKVLDQGGIREDSQEKLHDDMIFSLNQLKITADAKDDSMWSSGSSREMDWFLSEE